MDKKSNNTRSVSFGKLGEVEISTLEYEAPDVFAKLTSSARGMLCPPNYTQMGDSGSPFDDDQGCVRNPIMIT